MCLDDNSIDTAVYGGKNLSQSENIFELIDLAMSSAKFFKKIKSMIAVTSCSGLIFSGLCYYRNDEGFFDNFAMPLTRALLDAEQAHRLAVLACKYNMLPKNSYEDPKTLETQICGIKLKNPLGIAAGFDKDGEAIQGLHKLGFGFVEIGSVCPEEQSGNPKPRVFRLPEDEAVINRYGFNSKGHEFVVPVMRHLRRKLYYDEVIGVNMGKNKFGDAMHDYPMGVKVFSPTANYLVVNISSPNTPNLRDMQRKENLRELLKEVLKARLLFDEEKQRPILVKLSPDLSYEELKEIVEVTKKKECKIDGFIISNTTIDRDPNLKSKHSAESGGLSGKPLKEKSTKMIEDVYKLTNGKYVIVGVGGVSSGKDAFEKILAGASVVQIYSSFIYHGPPIVTRIKRELNDILLENGYKNVQEAVGKGVALKKSKFFFW